MIETDAIVGVAELGAKRFGRRRLRVGGHQSTAFFRTIGVWRSVSREVW
jgi:hypothetical protein